MFRAVSPSIMPSVHLSRPPAHTWHARGGRAAVPSEQARLASLDDYRPRRSAGVAALADLILKRSLVQHSRSKVWRRRWRCCVPDSVVACAVIFAVGGD
jgi:hypothetical protein